MNCNGDLHPHGTVRFRIYGLGKPSVPSAMITVTLMLYSVPLESPVRVYSVRALLTSTLHTVPVPFGVASSRYLLMSPSLPYWYLSHFTVIVSMVLRVTFGAFSILGRAEKIF